MIGIIGHGFVGSAVESGLKPDTDVVIVDPRYGTNIGDLVEAQPKWTFVCTPTPVKASGVIDSHDTVTAVHKAIQLTNSIVILKSTVTPDVIQKICEALERSGEIDRFLYVPEFLTERNAKQEYANPKFMVVGGNSVTIDSFLYFLHFETIVTFSPSMVQRVTPVEASFIKYAINSFLAMKVTFFNQLHDAMENSSADFLTVAKALSYEHRLGGSHWMVPGPDGKRGFGGSCFPKDVSAFIHSTHGFSLLKEVMRVNNEYRAEYVMDDREVGSGYTLGDHYV
jgi:UDPglucose 6-dehydrogenase